MKIVLDVLGAPASSGGMRLYADGVIRGWLEAHPEDELILLGASWLDEEFGDKARVQTVHWNNDSALSRIFGQFAVSAALFYRSKSDVLISLSPVVSPLVRRRRKISSVQDWRHVKNPQEFSRAQLLYRRLWRRSVASAGAVVTMSTKTQSETEALVPHSNSQLVETGRDYVKYWPVPNTLHVTDQRRVVTTFGHHSNKRPELVIDALGLLPREESRSLRLTVLGARGDFKEALRDRARSLDVLANCDFPGFVEEADYRALVRSSSLIVLASSDEGFGLPVAEANYLGTPALVTTDSGLAEIHTHGIVVAEPNPRSIANAMLKALHGEVELANIDELTTWADTASGFRALAVQLQTGASAEL